MNIREWIYPFTLAMAITFVVQYFLAPVKHENVQQQACSGQSFVAPNLERAQKPLALDVEFDTKDRKQGEQHVVKTKLATYSFSSKGAILQALDFVWQDGTKHVSMLSDHSDSFLLAFEESSPLYYEFVKEIDATDDACIEVVYQTSSDYGKIIKTFVIHKDSYQVDLKVSIDNAKETSVRVFLPAPVLSLDNGTSELNALVNTSNCSADAIKLETISLSDKKSFEKFWFEPKVFGFTNKFMVQSCIQANHTLIQRAYLKGFEQKEYSVVLESEPFGKDSSLHWSFYLGPKAKDSLMSVASFLTQTQTFDYGYLSFIARPMLLMLTQLKDLFGNYGIAILLLTLLLKLLLLPFTLRGEKSMKQQAEFQKKLAYVRQKYQHDKEALDRANAELIQKHGIPGVSGCLPMFLNIPFFIALNKVLSYSIELYGAKFLWLSDLSARDPYYILPVLTALCLFFTPMGNDPKQAMMRYGFALFLGTVTSYLSSGLALFIFANTALGLLQTYVVKKLSH